MSNSAKGFEFTVGESVAVWNYDDPKAPADYVPGYVVRKVEYEDVVVERAGVGFAIASYRVRRA